MIAKIFTSGNSQAVRLPKSFRFDTDAVEIRKEGEEVILTPLKVSKWPKGFFKSITISKDYTRIPQGKIPETYKL